MWGRFLSLAYHRTGNTGGPEANGHNQNPAKRAIGDVGGFAEY